MSELIRLQLRAGATAYPCLVGTGALSGFPGLSTELALRSRLRVIADRVVLEAHGASLREALRATGLDFAILAISGLERDKHLGTLADVYDWLLEVETDRSDIVVAFGGGVVGDLAGFAAATFMRGIRVIQLPTTLLAMVDSSIGGKTGVDHRAGKNLIGAFHQPTAVVADLSLLATLPARELAAGWSEVIKMGMVRSEELFERLERSGGTWSILDSDAAWAIARSIELKGQVVAADERESDLRMVLNYGHTIGHAIEAATGYQRYLHGEAVAIGMRAAAEIARGLGMLDEAILQRQSDLIAAFSLPDHCEGLSPEQLRVPLRHDKKAIGAKLRWVLPSRIGVTEVRADVPEALVDETLARLVRS